MNIQFNKTTATFLTIVIVLANLITRGPDLYHFLNTPKGQWFTGQASWFDHIDINTFFGAIRLGQTGQLLFTNFYDTQSHDQVLIYPFYTLLGFVSRPFQVSPQLTFHLAGIITSSFLIITLYVLNRRFLPTPFLAKVALLILVFGGGLGWLFYPKNPLPDLSMPGFNLMSALRSPHEGISSSLFLISVTLIFTTTPIWLGLTTFLALIFHPHMAPPLLAIAAAHGLRHKTPKAFLTILSSAALYVLLIGRQLLSAPAASGLSGQGSPAIPILPVLLGLGILVPFIGKSLIKRKKSPTHLFLILWFCLQWLLVLLPLPYHGMMIRGLWYPTVLLAILGLKKPQAALLLLLTTLPTIIYVTTARFQGTHAPRSVYISQPEGQTIMLLNTVGQPQEGVLASYRLANLVPAFTDKRVWYGHNPLTPDFTQRYQAARTFFTGQESAIKASTFLKNAQISWIIWGPEEQQLGNRSDFPYPQLTTPISITPEVILFKVR